MKTKTLIRKIKQKTGKSLPIINNGIKTIYTRLQRDKTRDILKEIGVDTRYKNGNLKHPNIIIDKMSEVWETVPTSQQNLILEQVAGVFHTTTLKSVLS